MKKMLTPMLLIPLLATSYPTFAAEESQLACRQIKDSEERVLCYDRIVDAALPAAPLSAPTADNSEQAVAPLSIPTADDSEQAAEPDAENLFGKGNAETSRIVEEKLAIEKIDHIQATVTGLKRTVDKKYTIDLDNGQIWRQIDHQRLTLRNEDKIIIREATFGSYLLEKQSGSGSIRVKRLD
jgi:hypothetical protein